MSFLGWMALGCLVLLLVALSSAYLRNLPISTSAIYLALGVAIGPLGFGWLRTDLREAGPWFERLTEVAVIVALFVGASGTRWLQVSKRARGNLRNMRLLAPARAQPPTCPIFNR
jgi:NhaP-type Na+/H+ or K+/H+ antiporter